MGFYFPLESMPPGSTLASLYDWYEQVLQGLNEPPLPDLRTRNPADAVIRFSHVPTFAPAFTVRATRSRSQYTSVLKVSSGQGGYPPIQVKEEVLRDLSDKEWAEYEAWLHDPDLWTPRSISHTGKDGIQYVTLDGNSWIAECCTSAGHRASARHGQLDEAWEALAVWVRSTYASFRK
jgi:hypothetical protein